jgi:hypothetical protein
MNITGLGAIPDSSQDYTSKKLKDDYLADMNRIYEIMSKSSQTEDDAKELQKLAEDLTRLLMEGDSVTYAPTTVYLTPDLAISAKIALSALQSAGFMPGGTVGDPIEDVKKFQALFNSPIPGTETSFGSYLSTAIGSGGIADKDLLGVTIDVLHQVNDDYFKELTGLEKSLSTTAEIIKTLTLIDNIANKRSAPTAPPFHFPPESDADIPEAAFLEIVKFLNDSGKTCGDIYNGTDIQNLGTLLRANGKNPTEEEVKKMKVGDMFKEIYDYDIQHNTPPDQRKNDDVWSCSNLIDKFLDNDSSGFAALYKIMADNQLKELPPVAGELTKYDVMSLLDARKTLQADLDKLAEQGITPDQVNSVAYFIKIVVDDIDDAFSGVGVDYNDPNFDMDDGIRALRYWITDGANEVDGTPGNKSYHTNIRQALGSAQNLNDSQTGKLEEMQAWWTQFLQMINMIASSVNEIITKSAQKI